MGRDARALRLNVELATLGLALISAGWFVRSALERHDTLGGPDLPAPYRRAAVLHRLALVADLADAHAYPAIRTAAGSWHEALLQRWGPHILPIGPALR